VTGILPLVLNSAHLISQFYNVSRIQETANLSRATEFLSQQLDAEIDGMRESLRQLGSGVIAPLSETHETLEELLRNGWVRSRLGRYARAHPELESLRVLNTDGAGPTLVPPASPEEFGRALNSVFAKAQSGTATVYQFVVDRTTNRPYIAIGVPVSVGGSDEWLIVEGLFHLKSMDAVFRREAQEDVAVFLIDAHGKVLWQEGADRDETKAFEASGLVTDFSRYPLNLAGEYDVTMDGSTQHMIGRVSPVSETRWGVVVRKPAAKSFDAVRRMVWNTVLSTVLLVALALVFAVYAARQISAPIQQMAETSDAIDGGDIGQRVSVGGVGREFQSLAENFNRMGSHVEEHIARLREAAQANEDLFFGTMRAFAAAIDAKDPYTRGHSERVAEHTRVLAEELGLPLKARRNAWIAAQLHDVGKIGVEDELLRKTGGLTEEEFAQMKRHPVIGADILLSIDQLHDVIPAVRWHHENWNGTGYPDGLTAEEIPYIARIVAVADTFDAITTERPYQRACTPHIAVETLLKLSDVRFDTAIVAAFLRAFEKGKIRTQEGDFTDLEVATARAAAIS
jgi:HD-GYP domain-containing protein (c-di-GMP phosphodiesterase class II)